MNATDRTLIGAVGVLAAVALHAENAVVLESFEAGLDSVTLMNWGGRPALDPPGVTLSEYTKAGDEDMMVTHGTKALQVDLSGSEWWSADFQVTLSEEASAKVREAAKSTDVARYILKWDFTFPAQGTTSWMNSQIFFGSINDQLDSNNGRRTMSIALDLVSNLPEEGPIVIQYAQNFDATEDPFTLLTVYLDNIRLVDTYAPGATPVTYVLQSFEASDNPTGGAANFTGWGGGQRTSYSQYTAADAEDVRVTHGTHALQVDYSGVGGWGSDFTIPFNGTKLAEVLKLDLPAEERPTPEQLARYTFRFDVIYPDRGDDWSANWMNTSYHTQAEGFAWSQSRPDGATGQRKTYSITLDETRWADWTDPKPSLMFIANGAWGQSGTSIYYDNFRLIDTGEVSGQIALKIAQFQYDKPSGNVTLRWDATAGRTYAIDFTENLGTWPTQLASGLQPAAGATTITYTGTVPGAGRGFLRVRMTN